MPTPIPAKVTADPIASRANEVENARTRWPRSITPSASTTTVSRLSRRVKEGAIRPNSAKQTGGSIPSSPTPMLVTANSVRISAKIGESAATAVRRLAATSRMPTSAIVRPCHSGRAPAAGSAPAIRRARPP